MTRSEPRERLSLPPVALALGYLVALAAAEILTALVEPRGGLAFHALLLVILLLHAAANWERPARDLLLALCLAPLIRLLSLSLPLTGLPLIYWYLITGVPLFAAAALVVRELDLSWESVGINLRALPLQLLVGLTGLTFGYLEYELLRPEPLIDALTWQQAWLPALILMVSTGLLEELIFRGVMQRAARETLGRLGMVYVAVLFAVLHVGHRSLANVLFVFGVALFFGWVVRQTRSIFGVTLSHGLTNIVLFLAMPFLAAGGPAPPVAADALPPDATVVAAVASPSLAPALPPAAVQPESWMPAPIPTWTPSPRPGATSPPPEAQRGLNSTRTGDQCRTSRTLTTTMDTKTIVSGTMAIVSTRPSALARGVVRALTSSF